MGTDAGKIPVVEFDGQSYDFNQNIEVMVKDPKKDINGWLAATRVALTEAYNRASASESEKKEVLAKMEAAINTANAEMKRQAEEVQALKRQGFDDANHKGVKVKLDGVRLSARPTEFDAKDEGELAFQKSYSGMTDLQFNILMKTQDELGIDDEPTERKRQRLIHLMDLATLADVYMSKKNPVAYMRNGGWESLPQAKEIKALSAEFAEAAKTARFAMNDGTPSLTSPSTDGGAWVPLQILSGQVFRAVEFPYALAAAIRNVPMAGPRWDAGVVGSRGKSNKLVENTADDGSTSNATMTAQSITTKRLSLQAATHAAFIVATPIWLQDNVTGADFVLEEIVNCIMRGEEDWFVNGQLTAQIDSALTIGATDVRNCGNGLRYFLHQGSASQIIDGGAGPNAELLAKAIGLQARYGNVAANSVWLGAAATAASLMVLKSSVGQSIVMRDSDAGARATFRTGSIAQAFGRDIIISNEVSANYAAGTSDLVDGAGGKTSLYLFNTTAVLRGERMGVAVEFSDQYRFQQYQDCYRAVKREAFTNVYDPTTEPFITCIANLPTS